MATALKTKVNQQDLKIYPSERLTQTDDGGGMPQGKPLTGSLNELFKPISSIARVNGAFYAVLEYMGVLRSDNEPLIGAFAAITKPPSDPTVSYLMSKAGRFGESRAEAINRIEAYMTETIESRMILLSMQSSGTKVIQAYQNVGEPLPNVSDVLCLNQSKAGYPTVKQYIKVARVSGEKRDFYDGNKQFSKMVIKLELTAPLKSDFVGVAYPKEGYADSPCKIYDTDVADTAKYFGVKTLAKAIAMNDRTLKLTAIMEQLIPTNQIENALIDVNVSHLPIVLNSTDKPTTILAPVQSYVEYVQPNNRSYSYTAQLIRPKKGSVVAKYQSQDKWYELKDDGNGKLVGASTAYGGGTINYEAGSAIVNCGEMPDIDSAIVVNYIKDVYQSPNAALTTYLPVNISKSATDITISQAGKTGTVIGNQITGDITGSYDIKTGKLKINPSIERDNLLVTYRYGISNSNIPYTQALNDNVDFTLSSYAKGTMWFNAMFTGQAGTTQKTYRDNGKGNLIDDSLITNNVVGTIDYATGKVSFKQKIQVIEQKTLYETIQVGSKMTEIHSGNTVSMKYTPIYEQRLLGYDTINEQRSFSSFESFSMLQTGGQSTTETFSKLPLAIEIGTSFFDIIAFAFTLNNTLYQDDKGKIMRGDVQVGTRQDNLVILSDFVMAQAVLKELLVKTADDAIKQLIFTTPQLRPASLKLNIDDTIASSTLDGKVMMGASQIGTVNYSKGVVHLYFNSGVKSIVYQAVALSYLPVNNNTLKIDTVRLPPDGRVPIFRRGDSILIRNAKTDDLGSAFTGGQTIKLSRPDVDRISLLDADNKPVLGDLWDYDLDAGSITFKPSIDLSPYKMPLKATHAQEQRNRIVEADIDGTLSLQFALNRDYPVADTYVSSLLIGDDLAVRASVPFTQRSWNNVWQDTPVGEPLLNKLKLTDYPMILTDDGAITDRWMIKFTSSSQFELYSEALGFVGKYDTLTNLAPINPATSKPYFTIDKRAFGTDTPWSPQDVIRFNTWGALMPVWVLCAVQPNPNPPTGTDGFEQYLFGDTTEIV